MAEFAAKSCIKRPDRRPQICTRTSLRHRITITVYLLLRIKYVWLYTRSCARTPDY